MSDRHQVRQFLLLVFVLLIPAFALWNAFSGLLAIPPIGFANTVLTHWFPGVVDTLYVDGKQALLMTRFGDHNGQIIPLAQAEYQLGFPVDTRILSYSIPFYSTLHFATQREDYLSSWIVGLLVLYPLMALGLLAVCLQQLVMGLGAVFFQQSGVLVPDANLIAILYQASVLIVPSLAPGMLWLWQSRNTPLLRGLFRRLDAAMTAAS